MLATLFSSRRIWNDEDNRPRSVLERVTVSAETGGSLIANGIVLHKPRSLILRQTTELEQVHPPVAEHQSFTPQRPQRVDVHQQY